jgi:hypothetical protein
VILSYGLVVSLQSRVLPAERLATHHCNPPNSPTTGPTRTDPPGAAGLALQAPGAVTSGHGPMHTLWGSYSRTPGARGQQQGGRHGAIPRGRPPGLPRFAPRLVRIRSALAGPSRARGPGRPEQSDRSDQDPESLADREHCGRHDTETGDDSNPSVGSISSCPLLTLLSLISAFGGGRKRSSPRDGPPIPPRHDGEAAGRPFSTCIRQVIGAY